MRRCYRLLAITGVLAEVLDDAGDALVELLRDVESCELVYIEAALCLAEVHLIVELSCHYLVILILFEPLDSLSFLPETKLRRLAWHDIRAEAVLFTAAPVA